MTIALRSHLVAGTAALGVTAIVVTPITQPDFAFAVQRVNPSFTSVALSGWDSPLTEALNSAILATSYLFNPISPNITATSNYWAYSGIGPVVQAALDNDLPFDPVTNALNTFQTLGVLPQIVADGLPIVTQLVTNASGYLNEILGNAFHDGVILSEAVWNLPGALLTATRQVIAGNITGALGTLQTAVVDPIVAVGRNIYSVGASIVGQAVTHVTNLAKAIPALVQLAGVHIVGTLKLLGQEIVRIASDTVTALRAGNAEGAWNTAVSGVFGPSGLPGLAYNETIGAGVQTGPVSSPSDIDANFVPSIRSFLQTSVQTIATAIDGPAGVALPSAVAPKAALTGIALPPNTRTAASTPRPAASQQRASTPEPEASTPEPEAAAPAPEAAAPRARAAASTDDSPATATRTHGRTHAATGQPDRKER